jgi:beta-lactam-binding protein with PASTA domain
MCVAVPDVVGQVSAAAADTILEGVGLDLGVETESCSAATNNAIIRQNPAAGLEVETGALVDVVSSSGVLCAGATYRHLQQSQRLGL